MLALVFDFDGLIVDTEMPAFQSWQGIYEEHGCSLPLSVWAAALGGSGAEFDPCQYLETRLARPIDREQVRARRWQRKLELSALQPVLPGVMEYIKDAKRLGLKVAVASSSSREWVGDHLARFEIHDVFDAIICRDDVKRVKPDPELYEVVLATLGVEADQALVLEDSPNGITAAKAAGIFCVAVPNALTCLLPIDHADLRLPSLAAMPLESLLALVAQR